MSIHNKNMQLFLLTTISFQEKTFLNLINFWVGWLLKFVLKPKFDQRASLLMKIWGKVTKLYKNLICAIWKNYNSLVSSWPCCII